MYCCEKRILRSTAIVTADSVTTVTLPNISTITNGDILRFVITQNIDYTSPLDTVSISINGQAFPIKDKHGNDVRIQQLTTRRVYTVAVGAQTPNVIMLTCIPCSTFVYPTYTTTTTVVGG